MAERVIFPNFVVTKKEKRMKKIIFTLLLAVFSLGASAQFEQYTSYLNTSLTGLNLSYSKDQKVTFGMQATGGFFVVDDWMLYGRFGYNHQFVKNGTDVNNVQIGAGTRYYIQQNGIYLGIGLQYEHRAPNHNYVQLTPEVGYCFFLNQHVTIEPAVYYDLCMNKFSEGSTVGLKVGFGFFF